LKKARSKGSWRVEGGELFKFKGAHGAGEDAKPSASALLKRLAGGGERLSGSKEDGMGAGVLSSKVSSGGGDESCTLIGDEDDIFFSFVSFVFVSVKRLESTGTGSGVNM
jgi:hypothetical protein